MTPILFAARPLRYRYPASRRATPAVSAPVTWCGQPGTRQPGEMATESDQPAIPARLYRLSG